MSRHFKKVLSILNYQKSKTNKIINDIEKYNGKDYIVFYNPEYIGIMYATKEIFKNTIALGEVFNKKQIDNIANAVVKSNVKQVIFSSITYGYKALIEKIYEKNHNIFIKFIWHGSHSLFVNRYEEYFLDTILDLAKLGIVKSIGFAKESMYKFYLLKGYNSYFIKNTVKGIDKYLNGVDKIKKESNNIRIGIYSSGDRWEKNTYNQLSACSLIKNPEVDCIPNTELTRSFCKLMHIDLITKSGMRKLKRSDIIKRMYQNDINLYVTFTECGPMVPLESLEAGVPCIMGDNSHYFTNTELEKYLIVKSEDSIDEIAQKIKLCIDDKDKILDLYKKWKKEYDIESEKSVENFLNEE